MSEPRTPLVETEDRKGVRWVSIRERKLGWEVDPRALKQALVEAIAGATRAAVDFGQVSYLCSSTIGTILNFNRDAASAGCKLAFCRMQPYVRDTFLAMGLAGVLPICDTEEQALELLG